MDIFVHDRNIISKNAVVPINFFVGARLFSRDKMDSFGADYQDCIKKYDEYRKYSPDMYLLLSEETYSASYNKGYVIGSDQFGFSDGNLRFGSNEIFTLEYIDDYSVADNKRLVNRPVNYIIFKYFELSGSDLSKYDYSKMDSRKITKANVIANINGERDDIKLLLAPESAVMDKDDVRIFRFDTYNSRFGTRDALSSKNSAACPVYISIARNNKYCFELSTDMLKDPDNMMYMGKFYALALPFDESVRDKRLHKSQHKQLVNDSCFNIDTFVYDKRVSLSEINDESLPVNFSDNSKIADDGKASSSDYSFADLVDGINAGTLYHCNQDMSPDDFVKLMSEYYDDEHKKSRQLFMMQMLRSQLDEMHTGYHNISLLPEMIHTFDVIGGKAGVKTTGTMLLLPENEGKYQLAYTDGSLFGHTLWNGRGDAVYFNNSQVPDTIRDFHFNNNSLHFPKDYILTGYMPDTEVRMQAVREGMGLLSVMEDVYRKDAAKSIEHITSPSSLRRYEPEVYNNTEHDLEFEDEKEYDKSL